MIFIKALILSLPVLLIHRISVCTLLLNTLIQNRRQINARIWYPPHQWPTPNNFFNEIGSLNIFKQILLYFLFNLVQILKFIPLDTSFQLFHWPWTKQFQWALRWSIEVELFYQERLQKWLGLQRKQSRWITYWRIKKSLSFIFFYFHSR